LKGDEIPVDTISKYFLKSLDAPAFSFPRHNSSRQLPSKLPADLLSAHLVWVWRGSVVFPLGWPLSRPPPGTSAFTLQVGQREEIIPVSHLKAYSDVDAMPGMPQQTTGPRRDGHAGRCPPRQSSCSQAGLVSGALVSSPSQQE
jgi:hypothetical protein